MIDVFFDKIFNKSYPRWIIVICDFLISSLILLSYNLYQLDNFITVNLFFVILIPFINFVFLYIFRAYETSLRYYTIESLFQLIIGFIISFSIVLQLSNFSVLLSKFTSVDLIIVYYISLSAIIAYRFMIKVLYKNFGDFSIENTLVFSSEDLSLIINFLNQSKYFRVVGIISVDKNSYNSSSLQSYALDHNLISIINSKKIKKILIPESLDLKSKEFIYQLKTTANFDIVKFPEQKKFLDSLTDFSLNPLEIEDLLSRDKIVLNKENISKEYKSKKILVTGGAGSIGSEIIRQILKFKPSEIIILDNSETPMFDLKSELSKYDNDLLLRYVVDTILNKPLLSKIISKYKPDIIFHAAAFKHVSMMEENPQAAIINNIQGTKNLIEVSVNSSVSKFVFISSDKAVNPSSVMGVTKRICELYLSKFFNDNLDIIITRFGNVLGSNGSVVKIFKDQISKGGPVTVTHPDVNRYFMTIPEASQLVLEAGAMGEKGEIFVFDMGSPIKISDLAKKMIRLSGKTIDKDINIEYTGLRVGEKLYEELLTDNENLKQSYNPLILIAEKDFVTNKTFDAIEELLESVKNSGNNLILIDKMKKIVKEYKPMNIEYN